MTEPIRIELDSLNLHAAERRLCEAALERAGSLVAAAALLGITRHALGRRIKKLGIEWPPTRAARTRPPSTDEQALLESAPDDSLPTVSQSSDPLS